MDGKEWKRVVKHSNITMYKFAKGEQPQFWNAEKALYVKLNIYNAYKNVPKLAFNEVRLYEEIPGYGQTGVVESGVKSSSFDMVKLNKGYRVIVGGAANIGSTCKIYSIQGRQISTVKASLVGGNTVFNIDKPNLGNQIYIAKFNLKSGSIIKKLIFR